MAESLRELDFGPRSIAETPGQRRMRFAVYAATVVLHLLVLVVAVLMRTEVRHMVSAGAVGGSGGGMTVFLDTPHPAGTTDTLTAPIKKVQPARAIATRTQSPSGSQSPGSGQPAGSTGTSGGATPVGPVRLGLGGDLTLLRKVKPIYPPVMEAARAEGRVVLDTIIRRDGTIGDVTVLQSSSPAFERAAIEAVKQWQYTMLPYEGIVTVTVNFTLAH